MSHSLYISTTESGSGKVLLSLGMIHMLLRETANVNFFRPIIRDPAKRRLGEGDGLHGDEDIELILGTFGLQQTYEESYGLISHQMNDLMGQNRVNDALEIIITKFKALEQRGGFIVCEGSDYLGEGSAFEFDLNQEIAKSLGCPILVLGKADGRTVNDALHPVQIAVDTYRSHGCQVVAVVLNQADPGDVAAMQTALGERFGESGYVLAVIPYDRRLNSPRVKDIAQQLQAEVLYGHHQLERLATNFLVAAMEMQHALAWLKDDSLIITPGDRGDVIVGMLQAHQSSNYPNIAGLLLSTGFEPESAIAKLIEGLPDSVPILSVKADTYTTVSQVKDIRSPFRSDNPDKIQLGLYTFERYVDMARLAEQISLVRPQDPTPRMFNHTLMEQARSQPQHIVLPESSDPRILKAAAVLRSQRLVRLTLLGQRETIERVLQHQGIQLDLNDVAMINSADSDRLDDYAQTFYQLRQHKGATLDIAHDYMLDATYYGTMMVYCGDADGMVSGATHTTQHTIRPALQLIKTQANVSLVSSIFLMYLADRVAIYGDCAVNPNPNAEQLADIAIASADTAQAFGIEPRVALLSYSSGDSAQGDDVDKVRRAAQIARDRRPDLKLEGPIQYDAAVDAAVAAQKLPGSTVAGEATVLVFPDLNTGNNTYKAVQRETGAIAIGPILQGLKKPVNDLSRGCTVDDIVNTVLITAIQAQAVAPQ
ncbi:phosphate acetyltransferase [Nodosilinea sp. LEGE 07088]|uniref:phosphate acetyltransferase n=1 Tax=Nodosilinea sp. LEGE 07088 TaxID=2777968 RepID=UPI001881C3E6|nr:phosphate acetyltransferase [Nodosilinea sp. LEGE 07088]MBE9141226.1 phosphate acetyltransferase [Nodosilinea sp. LEGE 07088]